MLSVYHTLDVRLARHVRCIWLYSGERKVRERLIPTGTTELVINLRPEPLSVLPSDSHGERAFNCGTVVTGPQSRYFVLNAADHVAAVGVHFRPGGAGSLLGLPLNELTNNHCSLEDVWGSAARELRLRLLECRSNDEIVACLETALIKRAEGAAEDNPYVRFALQRFTGEPSVVRVGDVVTATGYSNRQFIRIFLESVGLTPKRFCRIMRLQNVLRDIRTGGRPEWAQVALASGYCDQSHLVRDFRNMTGLSPSRYKPITPDSPNHIEER